VAKNPEEELPVSFRVIFAIEYLGNRYRLGYKGLYQ